MELGLAAIGTTATGKRHFDALGPADDIRDADGITVFSFAHAQARAREFFDRKAREMAGDLILPMTARLRLRPRVTPTW